jgi:hypothetical protein
MQTHARLETVTKREIKGSKENKSTSGQSKGNYTNNITKNITEEITESK